MSSEKMESQEGMGGGGIIQEAPVRADTCHQSEGLRGNNKNLRGSRVAGWSRSRRLQRARCQEGDEQAELDEEFHREMIHFVEPSRASVGRLRPSSSSALVVARVVVVVSVLSVGRRGRGRGSSGEAFGRLFFACLGHEVA